MARSARKTVHQLLGLMLVAAANPLLPIQGQEWNTDSTLPVDLNTFLAKLNKNSKLHLIYQQYRENRDGLEKAATRIRLAEAISRGVATSPLLASTVAEIQSSEWSGVAINREWVPTLSVQTSNPGVLGYSTTSTTLTTKIKGSEASQQQIYKHGFQSNPYADLSWAFFDATRGVRQAARGARTEALRNRLTFTTRELILAIQTSYVSLQEALDREKDLIHLFNEAVLVALHASKAQRPAGELSRLEAQVVSLLIARINAHQQSIQAANALASLINLEPGTLALPSESAAVIPIWPLSRADSLQRALERREELRANALDTRALLSDARAIRLKVLPALALSGQVQGNTWNQLTGSFNNNQQHEQIRSTGTTTFVGLTFDWKLFDGGIRNADSNVAEAQARQTMAQGQLTRLQISKEVADAYAAFVASKIQVDAARADVDASRRSLQGAMAHYASGGGDDAATTVVQALTKLQSALDTYRHLVASQNLAIHQLHRYTSSWSEATEALVRAQYQRWLPPLPPRGSDAP